MLEHFLMQEKCSILACCRIASMPLDTGLPSESLSVSPSGSKGERFSILDSAGRESVQPPAPSLVQSLFGLSIEQLSALVTHFGEPAFRARQLAQALYRDWIPELGTVTTLPTELRQKLTAEGYAVGLPPILQTFRSIDGTERYLIGASGNQTVETVWMPDGDGAEDAEDDSTPSRRRATICVSSQIGCAVNCQFCLTAKLGI